MRTEGKYDVHTKRLIALLRRVDSDPFNDPQKLAAHIRVSAPTFYRMLIELRVAYGAVIRWDAKVGAYRARNWGVFSRDKVRRQR